jgi:hypothetical protein
VVVVKAKTSELGTGATNVSRGRGSSLSTTPRCPVELLDCLLVNYKARGDGVTAPVEARRGEKGMAAGSKKAVWH